MERISPKEAAQRLGVDMRSIYDFIGAGELHACARNAASSSMPKKWMGFGQTTDSPACENREIRLEAT